MPKQIGERRQGQRERQRHAQRGGGEKADDEDQRAARAPTSEGISTDAMTTCRRAERPEPAPTRSRHTRKAFALKLGARARSSSAAAPRAGRPRSQRPTSRWPAGVRRRCCNVRRQAGTTSARNNAISTSRRPRSTAARRLGGEPAHERGDARMLAVSQRRDAADAHQPDEQQRARSPRSTGIGWCRTCRPTTCSPTTAPERGDEDARSQSLERSAIARRALRPRCAAGALTREWPRARA